MIANAQGWKMQLACHNLFSNGLPVVSGNAIKCVFKRSSQYFETTRFWTLYLKSSTDVNKDSKLNFEYSSFRILVACMLANRSITFHSRQTKTDLLVDMAFLSFTKTDGLTSIKWDDMLATNHSHRFCFQTQWAAFLTNRKERQQFVCIVNI